MSKVWYQSSTSLRTLLCVTGYGLLTACAGPGLGLWPLVFMGLAPVFAQVYSQKNPPKAFIISFCWMLGYGAISWSWIWGLYPLRWLGFADWQSALLTAGAWALAVFYPAFWFALTFWLLCTCWRLVDSWRSGYILLKTLVFALLWVGGLTFSQYLLYQTPLGLRFTDPTLALMGVAGFRQLLSLIGHNGLYGVIVGINVLLGLSLAGWKEGSKGWMWIAGAGALVLGIGTTGLGLSGHTSTQLPLKVWTVQGNLPIGTIRDPRQALVAAQNRYILPLSRLPYQEHLLMALPEEGAVPGWVFLHHPEQNPGFQALQHQVSCRGFSVVVGLSLWDDTTQQGYNAMALLQPMHRPQFYRKRHLVPFGESLPWLDQTISRGFLKPWGLDSLVAFSAGVKNPLPFTLQHGKRVIKLGPLVCLELLDTNKAMAYKAQGVSLLVVSSNLGWFQQAGPNRLLEAQYVALAQQLAAETSLLVVVSANAGPSVSVDNRGTLMPSRNLH